MWIVVVVVAAALAGGGVYLLSVRSLQGSAGRSSASRAAHPSTARSAMTAASGAVPRAAPEVEPAAAGGGRERRRFLRWSKTGSDTGQWKGVQPKRERPSETYVYVPLSVDEPPDAITRIAKLLMLLALVSVTGLLVALGLWQLGHVIGRAIEGYFAGG